MGRVGVGESARRAEMRTSLKFTAHHVSRVHVLDTSRAKYTISLGSWGYVAGNMHTQKKKRKILASAPYTLLYPPVEELEELFPGGCCEKYTPTPIPTAAKITIIVIKKHIHRFRRAARACFIATSTSATLFFWVSTGPTTKPNHLPFPSIFFDIDSLGLNGGDLFVLLGN